MLVPEKANCTVQDETQILKSQIETEKSDEIFDKIFTLFDHDYESSNGWCWNEYNSEVVIYIAGYVIKSIKGILGSSCFTDQTRLFSDTYIFLLKA